ncbi:unnamed protein product [Zymoseptoria tritici ST99CH_1E4]|uniref:Uncharacterized protein n=1 Tax=Zymoseptoria tritici ST99CH_1E4 TaxID=1276532 RepID=A0A2H1H9A2_ZYMTR|nr:unnamed protein product [Zymoseptoria tritici ST99CH_1E4]
MEMDLLRRRASRGVQVAAGWLTVATTECEAVESIAGVANDCVMSAVISEMMSRKRSTTARLLIVPGAISNMFRYTTSHFDTALVMRPQHNHLSEVRFALKSLSSYLWGNYNKQNIAEPPHGELFMVELALLVPLG